MKTSTFYCSTHHANVTVEHSDFTTGYGRDSRNRKHCFDCCGIADRERMVQGKPIALYLTHPNGMPNSGGWNRWEDCNISNWTGTLKFTGRVKKGNHNIAGSRYDVWFNGPDGYVWHGVQYGEMTQICHCKRTKEVWHKAAS